MVKVYDETDLDKVTFGRNGTKISTIKAELKEKFLPKPRLCCLLNEVVRHFSDKHTSDPGMHSQLKNALKKDKDFDVLKKDGRLVIRRLA